MNRLTSAVLTSACTLALVACGAEDEADKSASKETESETSQPDAGAVEGSGYSVNLPEGWEESDEQPPGFDVDVLAFDPSDTDDFRDNLNVLVIQAPNLSAKKVQDAAVAELEGTGAQDVEVQPRITVEDESTPHVTALLTFNGREINVEQFYLSREGERFVATFSFSPEVPAEERRELATAAMGTWTWSD